MKLTSRIILEGKKQFLSIVKPDLKESKKRKHMKISGSEKHSIIDEFEHEN
jgi:hypothetical protein